MRGAAKVDKARQASPAGRPAAQGDLFVALYPVREKVRGGRVDLSLRIKTAIAQALRECDKPAERIAEEMSDILPPEQAISTSALYACTAASKPCHHFTLPRFVAFVRVTGAAWLWDVLVEDDGLVIMEGREAKLANVGLLEQAARRIHAELRAIKAELDVEPVTVPLRRRRRP